MLTAPSTSLSQDEVAFLQHRVARFGLFGAALSIVFWLFRLIQGLGQNDPSFYLLEPSFGLHGLAWFLLLLLWVANRSGRRSFRFINTVESIGLVGGCLAYIGMGAYIPLLARPEMIVLSALTLAIAARAAYVPSSSRRTLAFCLAIGIPHVLMTYRTYSSISPEYLELMPPWMSESGLALQSAIAAGVWWTLTTLLSVGITEVIYGLRRQVRDVKKLGQYTIEEKLGEGGMGVVYRAHHGMLRRPTAIKLLHPDVSAEAAVERFAREVRLTAKLTHPNTVTIYDYGRTPDGVFYYAMELLEGAHLGEVVAVDGPQPATRVVAIVTSVASALAEAHGIGLIHRDIKPGNVILAVQGGVHDVAKVVDFGLVKDLEQEKDVGLTKQDAITGTPQYLAPEAITSPEAVDARVDIYALGAVAYFLVTGTHVFSGSTLVEVCSHHLHTAPDTPSARLGGDVPPDLEKLILDCLKKDPADRPQSATELVARLRILDAAGRWGETDAAAWWAKHRDALDERAGATDAMVNTQTLEVVRRKASELAPSS